MRCPYCGESHPAGTFACPKTQQRLAGLAPDDTVIDGKYRLRGVIGTGGMAVVYRAEHTKIGRNVALKMLLPEFLANAEIVARVDREARAAGSIDHPNVVAIVDLGSTPEYGPYIAMELLKGEDLATLVEKHNGRVPPDEAAEIVQQVLGALDAAHALGIVHRDLKPENVFLVKHQDRTVAKVLDFGISKVASEQGKVSSLTRTGTVMGTPQFMAPEQAAGAREQDGRVDVYAAGVLLYVMLSGQLPHDAENYNLLIDSILNKPAIPILTRLPALDPALAAIVMRALERKPEDRFQTAREMNDALAAWAEERAAVEGVARGRTTPAGKAAAARRISAANARIDAHSDHTVPVEIDLGDRDSDEDPTTSIPTVPDDGKGSSRVIVSATSPGLAASPTAPTAPNLADRTTGTAPVAAAAAAPPQASKTQTLVGWEHTPHGTALPPRRKGPIVLGAVAAALVLLGAGAFAMRQFQPDAWNGAVGRVGLASLAVPAETRAAEHEHPPRNARGGEARDAGRDPSRGEPRPNTHAPANGNQNPAGANTGQRPAPARPGAHAAPRRPPAARRPPPRSAPQHRRPTPTQQRRSPR